MKNVLIVSGHTNLQGDSFANKIILEDLQAKLPNATFDFLDQEYPNFKIDVTVERKKLEAADIIVLQFPIFWYSMPSLMAKCRRWYSNVSCRDYDYSFPTNG